MNILVVKGVLLFVTIGAFKVLGRILRDLVKALADKLNLLVYEHLRVW